MDQYTSGNQNSRHPARYFNDVTTSSGGYHEIQNTPRVSHNLGSGHHLNHGLQFIPPTSYVGGLSSHQDQGNLIPPVPPPPPLPSPPLPIEPETVDAVSLFRRPGRECRPQLMVFIFRGTCSGCCSYAAQKLKEEELKHESPVPRILCIDDYFVNEDGKYEYEPEMVGAYQQSLRKNFSKMLTKSSLHPLIILDGQNLLVDDFAPQCIEAIRCGYIVYLVELKECMKYCARSKRKLRIQSEQDRISSRSLWQEAPSRFTRLKLNRLLEDPSAMSVEITEVEMDMTSDNEQSEDDPDPVVEETKKQSRKRRLPDEEPLKSSRNDERSSVVEHKRVKFSKTSEVFPIKSDEPPLVRRPMERESAHDDDDTTAHHLEFVRRSKDDQASFKEAMRLLAQIEKNDADEDS